jgi:hypothetical protein
VGQRYFGLAANALTYHGFGLGVQAGTADVGINGAFGWVPVLIAVATNDDEPLQFFSTSQIAADAYAMFLHPRPNSGIGFSAGYRKNSLLGSGGAIGGTGYLEWSSALRIQVAGGLLIFPDGPISAPPRPPTRFPAHLLTSLSRGGARASVFKPPVLKSACGAVSCCGLSLR